MNSFARAALGPAGIVLALLAVSLNAAGYYYAVQRDEQARAVPLRKERGEVELAERHERGAKALAGLSAALVDIGYLVAAVALSVGVGAVLTGTRRNRWLAVVTVALLVACVALGVASHPNPALNPNGG